MTIEKLPSGSYRITQVSEGKRYRKTIDHRPTNAEAVKIMAGMLRRNTASANLTFYDASNAYIESKANILSPSTISSYYGLIRAVGDDFNSRHLNSISPIMVQSLVNEYAKNHSPKTVRNFSNFVLSVLKAFEIEMKSPKLPQNEKKSPYIPTEDEVKRILEYVKGSDYEIPLKLAVFGLRRSEICAITPEDVNGCDLRIYKALVRNNDGIWVVKNTKTTDSTRTITIPKALADAIIENNGAFNGYPGKIYETLQKVCDKLGIRRFPLHKLRHFYASFLHNEGFTDKQIQEMGGWKTDYVMKGVYQHAMEIDEAKRSAAEKLNSII